MNQLFITYTYAYSNIDSGWYTVHNCPMYDHHIHYMFDVVEPNNYKSSKSGLRPNVREINVCRFIFLRGCIVTFGDCVSLQNWWCTFVAVGDFPIEMDHTQTTRSNTKLNHTKVNKSLSSDTVNDSVRQWAMTYPKISLPHH